MLTQVLKIHVDFQFPWISNLLAGSDAKLPSRACLAPHGPPRIVFVLFCFHRDSYIDKIWIWKCDGERWGEKRFCEGGRGGWKCPWHTCSRLAPSLLLLEIVPRDMMPKNDLENGNVSSNTQSCLQEKKTNCLHINICRNRAGPCL